MNQLVADRCWLRWSRSVAAAACVVAPTLLSGVTAAATEGPVRPARLCGRAGDVSQLLLEMQKPAAERLWRDTKLFVLRDHDDGTLWAFSIRNSTVHPAVRCRRPLQGREGQSFEIGQVCAASDVACASFAQQVDEKFSVFDPAIGSASPL